MFEFIFSAQFLIGLGLGAVGGAYVGVLMGRRSQTANAYVDRIRAEYDERVNQLKQQVRELQAKAKQ
jgi:gas vesicle protein